MKEKYMSAARVSEILGITPPSVRRLVREGFLEVKKTKKYKAGSELYFDGGTVKALLPRMPALRKKMATLKRTGVLVGKKSCL
ncbi:MAG: hypothetical protein RQM92_15090 [Candidatus Syntrophopropionicum ammoniitolerans]